MSVLLVTLSPLKRYVTVSDSCISTCIFLVDFHRMDMNNNNNNKSELRSIFTIMIIFELRN